MLQTYLRIAWRNLVRNKTLSFINILGLSLGMTFAILIGMWIYFQYSFDDFNVNKDRIAVIGRNMMSNNQKSTAISMPLPLYDELQRHYPGIKRVTRMDWGGRHSLTIVSGKFNKDGLYVDPDFLKIFSFPLIRGNAATALNDPNSIVLTESVASSLFGTQDPIGKTIRLDNEYEVQVSAVLRDVPGNSSIRFEFLAPFQFLVLHKEGTGGSVDRWNNNFVRNVVEIREGQRFGDLNQQLGPLLASKNTGVKINTLFLYPMSRWNLYGEFKEWKEVGTQIQYIRLFGIIGIFILLIACINFMNLSTARSERRALEVGIRKTVGSSRGQLILQFLLESTFTAFLAFLLTLVFIQALLPYLKDLGFDNIRFDWHNLPLLACGLGVCLVTGLLAGSYPAFYLSSFRPVKVLKGKVRQGWQAISLRKVMVVTQFVASIALIISTLIVVGQIRHAKNRNIGYDPNNLVTVEASQDLKKNYDMLKRELLNTGRVAAVTRASSSMTWINNDFGNFSWEGKDPHADIFIKTVLADWDYEKTAGLQFVAGRAFSSRFATDSNAAILNEAAVAFMGIRDPIGRTIRFDNQPLTIIGVTKDAVMENPFRPVAPGVTLLYPKDANTILVRLKDGKGLRADLAAMTPVFERYNAASPVEYHFADEDFGRKFDTENQVAKLAGIFSVLAILISCLGLFGLAMFMAERRSKEVSIRKVLGATVGGLWLMLSREFVWLVLIAGLIASPMTVWLMSAWLRNYPYHIQIGWWIPVGTVLLAVLIALGTVSWQAIRVARANPADHLNEE